MPTIDRYFAMDEPPGDERYQISIKQAVAQALGFADWDALVAAWKADDAHRGLEPGTGRLAKQSEPKPHTVSLSADVYAAAARLAKGAGKASVDEWVEMILAAITGVAIPPKPSVELPGAVREQQPHRQEGQPKQAADANPPAAQGT